MKNSEVEDHKYINYELWLLLNRTRHLIFKARQREVKEYGISMRNAGILHTIFRLGKQASPGKIARETFLEPHSVSATLSRMQTRGLVKKVKDLERKNLIRIEMTEEGYEVYRKSLGRKSLNLIMSVLTHGKKLELWSLLAKIRNRAVERLGLEITDIYPPSDPTALLEDSNAVVPEDINYELWLMFNRTRQLIYKARQKEVNQYGISMQNAGILHAVVRLGGVATPGRIAREFFLENHSVSELLSRMEAQGLIEKVRDLRKKSSVRLEVTEKGYQAYRKSIKQESIDMIMAVLTRGEKFELWSLLSKVRDTVMELLEIDGVPVYPPSPPFPPLEL